MTTYDRVLAGTLSHAAGEAFETAIEVSLAWYESMGLLKVNKTPEPVKQIGRKDAKGHFLACHESKAQVDFSGTMRGGRAIRFEAKQTDTGKFERNRVKENQMQDLESHDKMGALCFVLLCFGNSRYYRVPWSVWRDMKQIYGRMYVTEPDLQEYRVGFEGGIIKICGIPVSTKARP